MTIKIMTKVELAQKLREIALQHGCRLTLKAALAIAEWLKEEQSR